jgi:hypothetical protein
MKKMLLVAALLMTGFAGRAQPANDNPCATFFVNTGYSPGLTCTASSGGLSYSGATSSGVSAPPCGAGGTIFDLWYYIVPSTSGTAVIKTTSTGDGALAVYSGRFGCGFFEAPLACNDDTLSSTNPACVLSVSQGETYYIRFWIKGSSSGTLNGICAVVDAPGLSAFQRVGIGTPNPQTQLDLNGSIQIRGGNPAVGKVLTSDAQGRASWQVLNQSVGIPLELSADRDNTHVLSVTNTNINGSAIYAQLGTNGYGFNFPRAAVWGDTEMEDAIRGTSKEGTGVYALTRGIGQYSLVADSRATGSSPGAARFLGNVVINRGGESGNQGGNLTVTGDISTTALLNAGTLRVGGASSTISNLNFPSSLGSKINLWGSNANSHYGMGIQATLLQLHTDFAGADIAFGYGSSTNFIETARIRGNGNVGFGTINPTRKLEIIAAAGQSIVTVGSRSGFGSGALEFVSDYGFSSQWRPGFIQSEDLGGFTGRLSFYTNGVGLANAYGVVKGLEVRNGVAFTATGTVSSFSDERLKQNIEPFTDGLNVIEQIDPVRFQYNHLSSFATPAAQVGVVAQQLEKVAPYMVQKENTAEMADLRSVNNQAYTFLLINAIKEQQQRIKKLEQALEYLQKQIRKLQN